MDLVGYSNGNLLQYKSRLAPLGYQQKHGTDYGETFAPVAMNGTNRLLMRVAAHCGRVPRKDVTDAFRRTELMHSKVYGKIPEGFEFLHPEVDRKMLFT